MFTLLQLLYVFLSPVTRYVKQSEKWTLRSSEAVRLHLAVNCTLFQSWNSAKVYDLLLCENLNLMSSCKISSHR